ncbi:hypothetical protein ACA910_014475 [Epithemia clementina (nom. ined.)]
MHILKIVIDGFKSYAHRTEIDGFDPHFNAITGLNGSGKSNILDSICFVLGISNLSQVRAGNLSELVYKQGQAGVNKAEVTIIFDNEDKNNSPVGYEACKEVTVTRQVLLGGKSKYFINGRVSPVGQVQNLFHSVQLNVNNPHFLIMQGRITKVLNMKAHEILGMVEEAAGTRMYETKRVAALKTIEKKQLKLDELNRVLAEEITPTLERLRGEKQSYLQWSKNSADIERMERFVVAFQYYKATKALEEDSDGSVSMEEKIESLKAGMEETKDKIAQKEAEIAERSSKLKGDFQEQLDKAKAVADSRSKELVKVTSAWQNAKDTSSKAESDLETARTLLEETKQAVKAKEAEITDETSGIDAIRKEAKEAEECLARLTEKYQNMSAGISTSQDDEGGTLPEQISRAHSDSKTAESKAKQAQMKIRHLNKELKTVEQELAKGQKSAQKLSETRDKAKEKVQSLRKKLESLNFSPEEYESMEQERSKIADIVNDLRSSVDTLSTQLESRLAFQYSDPVVGFDRSKVKGVVAKLVNVKDAKYSTALEVVAGGKLHQVVVDEAITGKALLNNGKLTRRTTIIPLDKIRSRQLTHTVCKKASEIAESANSKASPAIELVGFDEEVRNAVEYVFGSSIIVDGTKPANQICDATKTRTVTLEGDVYDPSGTISGGSSNQLGTTLTKLSELRTSSAHLDEQSKNLEQLDSKLRSLKSKHSEYERLSNDLAMAEAELETVLKTLSQTSLGILLEKRDRMAEDLKLAETEYEEMEQEKTQKWNRYEQLQSQEQELTQQRELKFAEIERSMKKAKADLAKKSNRSDEAEARAQTLSIELDSLRSEVEAAQDVVSVAEKTVVASNNKESDLEMQVGEVRALYEEANGALESVKKQMENYSSDLVSLNRERSDLLKEMGEADLEVKKLTVTIARIQKERVAAEKAVVSMQNKYPWIASEMSAFGVKGGDYDFDAHNPNAASHTLQKLKEETEDLSRKINKKVMGMIEKAEAEYMELLRKRKVVENDKKKIQAVIEELDVKKKVEIERTWVKVNRDFGSIFSTLLPGASAKLEPPEGMESWEGLEVKVAFGKVWKESLSELSGGQRSLLALSLILSMLLFRPAPMYILDEVDAALDLSHTQNIGNMLKTHFSQSQFIVVSLKEGMFNNANVIFKTKFVDGVSTVTRTIGAGSSRSRPSSDLGRSTSDFLTNDKRARRSVVDETNKENEEHA